MENFSKYFDEFVKSKKITEDLYYSESKEHRANVNKVIKLMSNAPEGIVLDAGCGVGNFVIPLSKRCKFVYGTDISKESLKICQQRMENDNIQNVSLQLSSVKEITLENICLDRILCFSVFQYLNYTEIKITIKEFKRILKHDGILILGFLNAGSPYGFSTKILRFLRRLLKGRKNYSSTNISYYKLKRIIEEEHGSIEIQHSAHFYPVLFPKRLINWISKKFYYEKYFPGFLKKYGFSILLKVRFY